jgi:hypothetical protein
MSVSDLGLSELQSNFTSYVNVIIVCVYRRAVIYFTPPWSCLNLLPAHRIKDFILQPFGAFDDFVRVCRRGIQLFIQDFLLDVAVRGRDMQECLQQIQPH